GSSKHIRLPAIPCRAWFNYVLHVRLTRSTRRETGAEQKASSKPREGGCERFLKDLPKYFGIKFDCEVWKLRCARAERVPQYKQLRILYLFKLTQSKIMLNLNTIGSLNSAQASVGDIRAQPAVTAKESSLKFENLAIPISSRVGDRISYYMDCLESCRGRSNPDKELKFHEIKKEADLELEELHSLRGSTFEYFREGTDEVYGDLKTGKTEDDRDHYILKLIEFYQIKAGIEEKEEDAGFKPSNLFNKLHHSSYLYGDIDALKRGNPIPDFYYNSGSEQFG
ncbi:NleF caspase inhibitor, partial [Burkholderia ubonensis]|uniref:NleF caspase inhibitor n=1 Tax=Burkholderia ubonensis TaxID=101571 RepID=UPI000ABBD8F8